MFLSARILNTPELAKKVESIIIANRKEELIKMLKQADDRIIDIIAGGKHDSRRYWGDKNAALLILWVMAF